MNKTIPKALLDLSKLLHKSCKHEPYRPMNWVKDEGNRYIMTNGHYLICKPTGQAEKLDKPKLLLTGELPPSDNIKTELVTCDNKPVTLNEPAYDMDYPDIDLLLKERDKRRADKQDIKITVDLDYLKTIVDHLSQPSPHSNKKRWVTLSIRDSLGTIYIEGTGLNDFGVLMPIRMEYE